MNKNWAILKHNHKHSSQVSTIKDESKTSYLFLFPFLKNTEDLSQIYQIKRKDQ